MNSRQPPGSEGCALIPLSIGLLVALWIYIRRHRQRIVQRTAYEIARRKLDQLMAAGMPQDAAAIERFFVDISAIVRRYLEDRFELHGRN